jgi:hypothetical protein
MLDNPYLVKKRTGLVNKCMFYQHLYNFHILVNFESNFPEKLQPTGSKAGFRMPREVSRLTPVKLGPNGAEKYIMIFLSF